MSAVEAVEPAPLEFDLAFQTKIAALSVRDATFRRRIDGLVAPEQFEDVNEAILVSLSGDYWEKYGTLPGTTTVWGELFKDAVKSKVLRKDVLPNVMTKFKDLLKSDMRDRDFVVDKVAEFARHQAIQLASLEMMDLVENGNIDKAQEIMESAFRVGASDAANDLDYWNDVETRTNYRKEKASGKIPKDGVTTGLKKLDNLLYHKGWGRKELSCLMGGAKKGKSTGLGEFALRASRAGKNVLYLTCEVATDIIADRMDANTSETDMSDIVAEHDSVRAEVDRIKGETKPGELRVMEFASGTLTCNQIRRIIERFKSTGIIFDLLVVDYADIMAPDMRTSDPIENSKQVWLGLRAIGHEENAAVLTATQTNRSGFTESTAKAEHAAEDFNKVRIVDLMITINRSDEERDKGEARLYFAASRNQEGEFSVLITQDLSKMKFVTGVKGVS